jgi:ABC-2 type transport system permease protein
MSFVRDTLIIFRRQVRLSLRTPIWVVIALLQPVLYLCFFGPLLRNVAASGGLRGFPAGSAYRFFVPGLLIQLGLLGASFVGFNIIMDWRLGVVERLRVTPVSRLSILTGRLLRDVITLIAQSVVLVLAGVVFGLRAPAVGVVISLGFIALVAISLASISYAVGLVTKSEEVLAPGINMVVVPMILLSGILLPMTMGPGWLQGIARVTPFRYIIDAMREAYFGRYLNAVMIEGIMVGLGMAAVSLWLASRVFIRENA